jgi:catalase
LKKQGDAIHFINEAFKHCKPIGAVGDGIELLKASSIAGVEFASGGTVSDDEGIVTLKLTADSATMADFIKVFAKAIQQHRHWARDEKAMVPA